MLCAYPTQTPETGKGTNKECRNKSYCSKYNSKLTDEEAKELLKLLDQYEDF